MLPENWQNVRCILAIQLDEATDIVMPALQALHQALPNTQITLMTAASNRQVTALPWINHVLVYDTAWQDAPGSQNLDIGQLREFIAKIRDYQFDAAVIFNHDSQSPYPLAYLCYLADIPIRLGQSKEFGGSVLSHWVKPPADKTHPVDRHLFLLESVGLVPHKHPSSGIAVSSIDADWRGLS